MWMNEKERYAHERSHLLKQKIFVWKDQTIYILSCQKGNQ